MKSEIMGRDTLINTKRKICEMINDMIDEIKPYFNLVQLSEYAIITNTHLDMKNITITVENMMAIVDLMIQ